MNAMIIIMIVGVVIPAQNRQLRAVTLFLMTIVPLILYHANVAMLHLLTTPLEAQ